MLIMNSSKLNNTAGNSAVSVCRNSSVMPKNNSVIGYSFKDASFGVSFFNFFRFFGFSYYYFYFTLFSKCSTASLRYDMCLSA